MDETSSGGFWETLQGSFFRALDYQIDDSFGTAPIAPSVDTLNPFPETTAPSNANPTEAGFTIGNNTETYALGLGLLVAALVVYRAVK